MRNSVIAIFACCIFAAACGSKTDVAVKTDALAKTVAPAKTVVPAEFSKACNAENDKKIIEISGYLSDDDGVECSEIGGGGEDCRYKLKENPTDKKGIKADIKQGSSANQVEKLPLGYERKDIKIHASDGNIINLADKVKLTGEMSSAPGEGNCVMKATKIEKQ
jgi:hypothetical protein